MADLEYRLGDYVDSANHFRLALRQLPTRKEPEYGPVIRKGYDQARQMVAQLELSVTPSDAHVEVEGQPTIERLVHLAPGRRRVNVSAVGYQSREQWIDAKRGVVHTLSVRLSPVGEPTPETAPDPGVDERDARTEPRTEIRRRNEVLWIGGGVTLALGVTSAVFYFSANQNHDELRALMLDVDQCTADPTTPTCDQASELRDGRRQKEIAMSLTFAGSIVALAATGLTYALWTKQVPLSANVSHGQLNVGWQGEF